jgi:hypothetical protein
VDTLYGTWDYGDAKEPYPYDDTPSYALAGAWVSGRGLVEDWGSGAGWMRQHIDGPYRGVDGAWSPFAEVQADLRTYCSDVPCAVMRHVLEHNPEWRTIAENFTDSWHDRAALVLFIPPQLTDTLMSGEDWPIPDIAVSGPDLMEILGRHGTQFQYVDLTYPVTEGIQYAWEGVVLMER